MDCSEALNDFHDSTHDFSTYVGGYIDGDHHISIGDIVSAGLDSGSGYVIVDTACGDHETSMPPDAGTDTH